MFIKYYNPNLHYAQNGFRYNNYTYFLKEKFGERTQRISIDGGFTCPNRDGTKGTSGCIYCNNRSFSPFTNLKDKSIKAQVRAGLNHFHKLNAKKFIAYFQSHTNTYAPVSELRNKYYEAINFPEVVGIAISTRPDCLSGEIFELLKELNKETYLNVEIGIESIYEKSLKWMNREHNYQTTVDTIEKLNKLEIDVTGHIILGLPTETQNDMLKMAKELNKLPLKFLKIHHLQVIKNTPLARIHKNKQLKLFSYNEYLEFVSKFISHLKQDIILQRIFADAPLELLIAPNWDKKSPEIIMDLQKYMRDNNLYQGKYN
ncbi:MAG: TIGR01212 family radical SAM protein [Candidatus Marinimicrobia bacterium]|nr:TIGR01212 family radical SAM protein [Candidatus Neomarinimicrobiota bacterium]